MCSDAIPAGILSPARRNSSRVFKAGCPPRLFQAGCCVFGRSFLVLGCAARMVADGNKSWTARKAAAASRGSGSAAADRNRACSSNSWLFRCSLLMEIRLQGGEDDGQRKARNGGGGAAVSGSLLCGTEELLQLLGALPVA